MAKKKAAELFSPDSVHRLERNKGLLAAGQASMSSTKRRQIINVLGVGGVGSNIAEFVSRGIPGRPLRMRIYDADTVDLHNLNRSWPFTLDQIGKSKVGAIEVACNMGSYENDRPVVSANNETVTSETAIPLGLTIDSRDTLDPTKVHDKSWIKLAYDGGSLVSFVFKPAVVVKRLISLGGDSNYEVVPSFYVPAALLATMSICFMQFRALVEVTDHRAGAVDFNIDNLMLDCMYEAVEPAEEAATDGNQAEYHEAA